MSPRRIAAGRAALAQGWYSPWPSPVGLPRRGRLRGDPAEAAGDGRTAAAGPLPRSPGRRARATAEPQFRFHVPPRLKETAEPARRRAPARPPRRRGASSAGSTAAAGAAATRPTGSPASPPGAHAFAVRAFTRDGRARPGRAHTPGSGSNRPRPARRGGGPRASRSRSRPDAALAALYPGDPAQQIPLADQPIRTRSRSKSPA